MSTQKEKKKTSFGKLIRYTWILFALILLIPIVVFYITSLGWLGPLPTFDQIENPKSNLASRIISADQKVLGKFYKENRTHVEYEEIAPHLIDALISTEDERFYRHIGIDLRALARALTSFASSGGASTITQQLAKNLFHEPPTSTMERVRQKLKEWVIAVRLERQYTKNEIITMYLNQVDFIYQAMGIQSAASIYFDTTPDSLDILESAVLVGMAKNPSLYNPVRDSLIAVKRRNVVLAQMVRNGKLEIAAYDTLKDKPLIVKFTRQGHDEGVAPYFREYIRSYMREWVKNNPKPDGSEYNIYTDGLKIYTTIDMRMQKYAEEAVQEHMSNLQRVFFKVEGGRAQAPFNKISQAEIDNIMLRAMRRTDRYRILRAEGVSNDSILEVFNTPVRMRIFSWDGDIDTLMTPMDSIRYYKHFYQTGFMACEPQTGFVKAWVGGINFKHFKFDHVKLSRRQAGSTFKPFVYATAIKQKNYSPCFEVPNTRICIEKGTYDLLKDWCPENSNKEYGGMMTLREALAKSINTVTTYLMKQIGPEPVVRLCQDLGIKSDIPIQPSIALGTLDLSVYELVGAYTCFGNEGVYSEPIMITRIEDKNGIVLDEFSPYTKEVMNQEDAYLMVNLLKGVTMGGTGTRLRSKYGSYPNDVVTGFPYGFENPIAGKTGTTQNNSDGWFVGMVPNLVAAAWTGCEDRAAHFRYTQYGQGATTALPIWALFMKKCYNDTELQVSKDDFERPEGVQRLNLDCNEIKGEKSPETEFGF